MRSFEAQIDLQAVSRSPKSRSTSMRSSSKTQQVCWVNRFSLPSLPSLTASETTNKQKKKPLESVSPAREGGATRADSHPKVCEWFPYSGLVITFFFRRCEGNNHWIRADERGGEEEEEEDEEERAMLVLLEAFGVLTEPCNRRAPVRMSRRFPMRCRCPTDPW